MMVADTKDGFLGESGDRRRPAIAVIGLGGTIASVKAQSDSPENGALPQLTAADLVDSVPEAVAVAELSCSSLRLVSSASLTLADVLETSAMAEGLLASGANGIVVTQGTDTLEETSYVLDLLHNRPEPIVITGAMRVAGTPGADGPANLLAAIRVAASPRARDLGALVVMAEEIHAARWVTKRHTSHVAAFASSAVGPIGWLSEGRVRIAARPVPHPRIDLPDGTELPPVAVIALGLGDDGRLLTGLFDKGFRGVVIEGMGGGHVPETTMDILCKVAREMPVVISSRTGCGELLRSTYAFPGSETDLRSRGVISGGTLDTPKARLLLTLLLASGTRITDLREVFERYSLPHPDASSISAPAH